MAESPHGERVRVLHDPFPRAPAEVTRSAIQMIACHTETIRYNWHARQMLHSLREKPPSGMRTEVGELCDRAGLMPAA